jgi:curved DNA-binding protein CbpA
MSSIRDPYRVLQVDPAAEPEVVRAAYRALALKYHPDVRTGSQDRMAALNQAWCILRDPTLRSELDGARATAQAKPEQQPRRQTARDTARDSAAFEMPAPLPATPPGKPSGSVLDFGRYEGWSLGQIAATDPVYLEWFSRTPIGRSFNREIESLLAIRTAAASTAATATAERQPRRSRRG